MGVGVAFVWNGSWLGWIGGDGVEGGGEGSGCVEGRGVEGSGVELGGLGETVGD